MSHEKTKTWDRGGLKELLNQLSDLEVELSQILKNASKI